MDTSRTHSAVIDAYVLSSNLMGVLTDLCYTRENAEREAPSLFALGWSPGYPAPSAREELFAAPPGLKPRSSVGRIT